MHVCVYTDACSILVFVLPTVMIAMMQFESQLEVAEAPAPRARIVREKL